MDAFTLGLVGVAALLVLLAFGLHIGITLLTVGMLGLGCMIGFESALGVSMESLFSKISSYELITVPLFVFMGYLASAGGVSERVFTSLNHWVGRVPGGLGISTTISCTAFGTVCGSSLVTASVFARICAPQMRKFGYDKKVAYGVCAAAGMIGMLIPPSILMVVYGVLSGDSVGKLLIAGIMPGLLLMVFFSVSLIVISKYWPNLINQPPMSQATIKEKLLGLISIWQIWVVAIVIFGGIFGGIFNPTEAAAVAAIFLLALLIVTNAKKMSHLWPLLKESFYETAGTTAMIFLVMSGATVFSQFLVLSGITEYAAVMINGLNVNNMVLVFIIMLFYVALGCFLDSTSMLCITIPILNPIIVAAGIDPIWYAVMVVMAIEVGLLTPPVGLNVYGAYAVAEPDVTIEDIFKGCIPFFVAIWIVIALLFFIEPLATFLPNLMITVG